MKLLIKAQTIVCVYEMTMCVLGREAEMHTMQLVYKCIGLLE